MQEMCGEMEVLRAAAADQQPMGPLCWILAVGGRKRKVVGGRAEEEADCPP